MNQFVSDGGVVAAVFGGRSSLVLALVAVLVIAIAVARRLGGSDEEADATDPDGDEADSHSVWDAIPSWQYAGRHVESGGLARDDQEKALREIQAQAAEIERREGLESGDDEVDPDRS